ncbi:Bug family tripartite tricarboxylate transporter substrate binding protein [Crenalkalicoccus roseus]|uniref:Bug family tripartite tricarboxylate transporter substrate binding protein n=1 Tax=Crenalkalicoccus roseus TaxID=1485588 RepID=UPI0010809113|nr:tripartite tricarboxylate transporter substrate binding protein [Crenalkalicoccus roseus]
MTRLVNTPRLGRRALLGGLAVLPGAALAFPERPVRLVLGFPPGTGPDLVARLLAEGMREGLPAGLVVENRPGAAGHIAAQEVARAVPDGHTLLLGEVGQLAMAPSTYARLPYDPARDFAPVAEIAAIDFAFVVPASVPAEDLAGFAAWARGRGQVFLATFGAGTPGHFGASLLAAGAGVQAEPVHFRSTGEAMTAVLNGEVQGLFGTVALVAPHVQAGRVRALATTGTARSALLPAVPTVAEAGRPDLALEAWFGLVAPAGTPEAALAALEAAALRALGAAALRQRLQEAGFRVSARDRAGFAAHIRAETARWAEVVRRTGFRALE